ncbi:MAG: TIGR01459 family HAD-type hydrolase [Verrucomicrobia bacterium]|nr:TIGR01459 family HAD-type hydrolase [Verrucomicrobiota bacterium]
MVVAGLLELVDDHDVFLIDQFGVLRDASGPYPAAPETLSRLKALGKHIIILSNSGKRAAENDVRFAALGFAKGSWDLFLTSGEVAWRMMAQDRTMIPAGKARCLLVSRDHDLSPLTGLPLEPCAGGESADIVLLAGSEADRFDLEHYRKLLEPAARRKVPCLCTNPDMLMLTPVGPRFGAGRIAGLYQEMGGPVRFIGKPFADIYRLALRSAGNPDRKRVICLGDSIEHDIVGARQAGLRSALVTGGILEGLSDAARDDLCRIHSAWPDYLLPGFVWQAV